MWMLWVLRQWPILGWILAIAVVLVVTKTDYGVRPVRLVDRTSGVAFLRMTGYARSWIEERRVEIENAGRSAPYPIYIVTSDGGGARSSLWTASILGGLTDRQPAFARHVFAISAVSGGSVGAAVYGALLRAANRESRRSPRVFSLRTSCPHPWRDCLPGIRSTASCAGVGAFAHRPAQIAPSHSNRHWNRPAERPPRVLRDLLRTCGPIANATSPCYFSTPRWRLGSKTRHQPGVAAFKSTREFVFRVVATSNIASQHCGDAERTISDHQPARRTHP